MLSNQDIQSSHCFFVFSNIAFFSFQHKILKGKELFTTCQLCTAGITLSNNTWVNYRYILFFRDVPIVYYLWGNILSVKENRRHMGVRVFSELFSELLCCFCQTLKFYSEFLAGLYVLFSSAKWLLHTIIYVFWLL